MLKRAAVMIYPEFSLQEITCLTSLFLFNEKGMDVFASEIKPFRSEDGFNVVPNKLFSEFNHGDYDVLILPGIWDFKEAIENEKNIEFLKSLKGNKDLTIAAISSAPILLAKAGLLDNTNYTAGLFEEAHEMFLFLKRENRVRKPVVIDKNIITAIGFAFREFAVAVAKQIGIKCTDKIYQGVTKEYTPEELTYYSPK